MEVLSREVAVVDGDREDVATLLRLHLHLIVVHVSVRKHHCRQRAVHAHRLLRDNTVVLVEQRHRSLSSIAAISARRESYRDARSRVVGDERRSEVALLLRRTELCAARTLEHLLARPAYVLHLAVKRTRNVD